jgi:PAS domain S-box-containing protein
MEGTMSNIAPQKLLLVEDEAIIALAEKKTLESFGFEVVLAMGGEESVDLADTVPGIDLVLMDINLGRGIDGTEAAARILGRHDLPLVFLTSHTEREVVDKTESISSYGYIVKNSGDLVLLASIKMAFKLFESKRSETAKAKALELSEKKYRQLIENSHDVIYTLSPEGILTFVSPSWTDILGHPVDQVLGRSFEDFVHPDDIQMCRGWLVGLLESGTQPKPVGRGYRVRHLDGHWRWHSSNLLVVHDAAGMLVGIEGIARDVTESKHIDEELKESRQNLQSIFDAIDESIFIVDRHNRVLAVNRTLAERVGRTVPECVGQDVYALVPPDVAEHRRPYLERVFETGKPVTFDDRRQDRWIHQSMYPIKDDEGHTIRVAVYGSDVTERKNLEQILRVSETLYRTLFEVAPMGLTVSDASGNIIQSNKQGQRLLGVTEAVHTSRKIDGREWSVVRKDGSPMPVSEFASTKALKEGRLVENVEMGIVKDGGQTTWINVSAVPVPLEGYGVVVTYNDITERLLAEKKVEALLAEKELILKETHHRIKNNMGTVSGLLRLQAGYQQDAAANTILNDAAGRVQSMMVLYDKLYHSEDFTDLNIKSFLSDLVGRIMGLFKTGREVQVDLAIEDFILGVKILSPLGIIINELITNSMKYAFDGASEGIIRVSANKTGTRVTLRYEDNGPGLPESTAGDAPSGFGMQLIALLVQQIKGTLDIGKGAGASYVIEFDA